MEYILEAVVFSLFLPSSHSQYIKAQAEDCKEGYKVVGNGIVDSSFDVPSIINCNLRCLHKEHCVATNFQSSMQGTHGRCELLLPHDLTDDASVKLEISAETVYTKLKRNGQQQKKPEAISSKSLKEENTRISISQLGNAMDENSINFLLSTSRFEYSIKSSQMTAATVTSSTFAVERISNLRTFDIQASTQSQAASFSEPQNVLIESSHNIMVRPSFTMNSEYITSTIRIQRNSLQLSSANKKSFLTVAPGTFSMEGVEKVDSVTDKMVHSLLPITACISPETMDPTITKLTSRYSQQTENSIICSSSLTVLKPQALRESIVSKEVSDLKSYQTRSTVATEEPIAVSLPDSPSQGATRIILKTILDYYSTNTQNPMPIAIQPTISTSSQMEVHDTFSMLQSFGNTSQETLSLQLTTSSLQLTNTENSVTYYYNFRSVSQEAIGLDATITSSHLTTKISSHLNQDLPSSIRSETSLLFKELAPSSTLGESSSFSLEMESGLPLPSPSTDTYQLSYSTAHQTSNTISSTGSTLPLDIVISSASVAQTLSTTTIALPSCHLSSSLGKCFQFYYSSSVLWNEAKTSCQSKGAYLTIPDTSAKREFLYQLHSHSDFTTLRRFHAGFEKPTSSTNAVWVNGLRVSSELIDEECDSDRCCGYILRDEDAEFTLQLEDGCDAQFPYVCEWTVS